MRLKPVALTVVLLVLFSRSSYADTFIVTSNANDGPGTLREAIGNANANGTAVTDYIHFNIPQPFYNSRIITLVTELPALSSNLVIDGTTQAGMPYGTTEAKICLLKTDYAPSFSMLKIENAQNVQVYGMHLYYGYWQGFFGTPYRSEYLYGINIINSSNIMLGAAGKGNVISGVVHAIYSADRSSNITIRSNYLGHGPFYTSGDVDNVMLSSDCCITFGNVKDIYIGGPLPEDGNIFGSGKRGINIDSKYTTGNGLLRIQNNLFARKYDKVARLVPYDFWDYYIEVARSRNNPVNWTLSTNTDYRIELLDNDIPTVVNIAYTTDSVIVLRNKFIEDGRRQYEAKLNLGYVGKGIIGGDDPVNANYFFYKKTGYGPPSIYIYESGPITILKNVFTCNSTDGSTVIVNNSVNKTPFIQIDITTSTSVTGRAAPNSRVDLYYDDECTACEGKVYLATVQSDAAGAWTYSGSITGTVIATATKNGYTSMFSYPSFNETNRKIVQPTCGLKNGSITGITSEGSETYFWINFRTGDTVSRALDLVNAGPGEYALYAVHGGTCIKGINQSMVLEDITPQIYSATTFLSQPGCGKTNGSITGMRVYYHQNSKLEWKNEAGLVVGNNIDIYNLPPGKYTFYVTDVNSGCFVSSPTYELINQSGPSLDISALQITPTNCGGANGSIKGITATNVTGTPFTQWVDATNKAVGSGYDLVNVVAGTYRFKFKDQGSCDTIIRPFTINAQTVFSPITVTSFTSKDGFCDQQVASINIQAFSTNAANYTFRWENSMGATAGTGTSLSNLPGGAYNLFATDVNNCESKIFTTTVKVNPTPTFHYASTIITKDTCNLKTGSVLGWVIKGTVGPTTFAWLDENGNEVDNSFAFRNVAAGTYTLRVTDGGTCIITSIPVTIEGVNPPVPAPAYTNLIIPRHSDATITVKNPSIGNYKLYSDASGTALMQQNITGNFTIAAVPADVTYYVQQLKGSCSSPLVPVSIKVVDKSYFTIANAFTPNKDGKNDQLTVRAKGYIDVTYFRVFNRYGQVVFETSRLNDGWNGYFNGILQPADTYVWVAEGKDLLGVTIKDKGSFVLIK